MSHKTNCEIFQFSLTRISLSSDYFLHENNVSLARACVGVIDQSIRQPENHLK